MFPKSGMPKMLILEYSDPDYPILWYRKSGIHLSTLATSHQRWVTYTRHFFFSMALNICHAAFLGEELQNLLLAFAIFVLTKPGWISVTYMGVLLFFVLIWSPSK